MATHVKTFNFAASAENWTASGGTNITLSYNGTDQCLQARCQTNEIDESRFWEWTGTWEDLGVPAGSTITNVKGDYNWRCTAADEIGSSSATGAFAFFSSGGTPQGTFSAGLTFTGTSAYATRTGSTLSVHASLQASTTTVKFRLTARLNTDPGFGPDVILQHDVLVLTMTYTAAASGKPTFAQHYRQMRAA